MGSIHVVNAGGMVTVQDMGRYGYQSLGVPVSGAMDTNALKIANRLVGNDDGEACLEFVMTGGQYHFSTDTAVALTGADMDFKVNDRTVPMYETLYLHQGDELTANYAKMGVYAYMAVSGGIDVPKVLGSRSTFIRGRFGGVEGRALRPGDQLPLIDTAMPKYLKMPNSLVKIPYEERTVHFTPSSVDREQCASYHQLFQKNDYRIDAMSDRMGYRLSGDAIQMMGGNDMLSVPVGAGTIQLPGNGQPIVLLADRQTTGGYRQLGQIWTSDMSYFVQQQAGSRIRFCAGAISAARAQLKAYEDALTAFFSNSPSKKVKNAAPKRYRITIANKTYQVVVQPLNSDESIF
ncbi:biotin-dependent carboxyltransferase family protein [Fusibacter paucivorans]|uniref:Biotin-dependent carboxyltransferase family protein n=1 Tax=Fusibacter paucivorans TaxID=76009 RepID=A0ABS5PK24_9FIRM|nr:biotin-dependent carboxyltransferase family protein [Fusibacter paucivorans]MBS7525448.1 biotin-dependent carboxyltransferase family protein [Fusibacter paucivorans]